MSYKLFVPFNNTQVQRPHSIVGFILNPSLLSLLGFGCCHMKDMILKAYLVTNFQLGYIICD